MSRLDRLRELAREAKMGQSEEEGQRFSSKVVKAWPDIEAACKEPDKEEFRIALSILMAAIDPLLKD